jgi:hypothetical protein
MSAPSPAELDRDLAAFFARGADAPVDEAAFDRLALRVFAHQYEALAPYRAYCQRRGALPQRLRTWSEIPAVPVAAFKDARLIGDEAGVTPEPARIFRTSGTTTGGRRPGEHALSADALALYHASLLPTFRAFVLPELAPGRTTDLVPLVLGPSEDEAPHSSLWHMVEVVGAELFGDEPRHFLAPGLPAGPGAAALDAEGLARACDAAYDAGRGICLFTTDLALDRFLAVVELSGWTARLPAGSRIVHTGGAKGLVRAIDPTTLYARVERVLGIPAGWCVNEYGMTEMTSQFYDATLFAAHTVPGGAEPVAEPTPRLKFGPPWVRALVVDVHTLEPLPPGQPGLLRVVDLANRGSVAAILTEDFAVAEDVADAAGADEAAPVANRPRALPFRLLGRARGSEPRGCSLEAEDLAASTSSGAAS